MRSTIRYINKLLTLKTAEFTIENSVLIKYTGNGSNVVIPDGVTKIGEFAFSDCESLTSVTILDSVIKIEETYDHCDTVSKGFHFLESIKKKQ